MRAESRKREHRLLLIRSSEVERLLPMRDCIGLMEEAFKALADGLTVQPVRHRFRSKASAMSPREPSRLWR